MRAPAAAIASRAVLLIVARRAARAHPPRSVTRPTARSRLQPPQRRAAPSSTVSRATAIHGALSPQVARDGRAVPRRVSRLHLRARPGERRSSDATPVTARARCEPPAAHLARDAGAPPRVASLRCHSRRRRADRGKRSRQRRWPGRLLDRAASSRTKAAGCSSRGLEGADDARQAGAPDEAVAVAAGRARRLRAGCARDLRSRGRGSRRELRRLPARQRTGARRDRADALGLRAAEHPARTPAALRAGRAAVRHRLELSRVDRCAGVRQRRTAPGSTPPGAPGRCRSPTSAEARAVPAPGRRCGNATPSAHTPASRRSSTIPADAIYTAARILREDMGAPPTGGTYTEYHEAACHYYGACADAPSATPTRSWPAPCNTGSPAHRQHPPRRAHPRAQNQPHRRVQRERLAPEAAAARRSSRSLKARSARASTPKAPTARSTGPARSGARCSPRGSGSTPGCRSPAPRPPMATPGRSTPGPKNTAAEYFRRPRRPSPGDAVFYGTGPSESAHVGIVQHVYPDGRDHHDRGKLREPRHPSRPVPARPRDRRRRAAHLRLRPATPRQE